jgi:hypothetical protein
MSGSPAASGRAQAYSSVQRNRKEQHGHHRERARRGLEHAPGHEAPLAAREVLHHEHGQRADRDVDPEDVRDEVRLPERLARQEEPGGKARQPDAPEHQAPRSHPLDLRARARGERRLVEHRVRLCGHYG